MTDGKSHMFDVDQVVSHKPFGQQDQVFRIVRLLPAGGGGPQYRIRSEATGQERVAEELQLKAVQSDA